MHSAAHILDHWREFPAAAEPRPSGLVDGDVGRCGFPDDASNTLFLNGAIDAAEGVEVPMAVLALLRPPPTRPSRRLEIATVERLQSTFQTDRGPAALPSSALPIPGADEPVIVLDPETPVWWPPEPSADSPGEGG